MVYFDCTTGGSTCIVTLTTPGVVADGAETIFPYVDCNGLSSGGCGLISVSDF